MRKLPLTTFGTHRQMKFDPSGASSLCISPQIRANLVQPSEQSQLTQLLTPSDGYGRGKLQTVLDLYQISETGQPWCIPPEEGRRAPILK